MKLNQDVKYEQFIQYKAGMNEYITNEQKKHCVVHTENTKIVSSSDQTRTSYQVIIKDTFEHKTDQEITPQVILHSIQTLVDQTTNYLISHNIRNISPIVYLLNIHQKKKIKDLCKALEISENILINSFLENAFETNFSTMLKGVLTNLCITDKVSFDSVVKFLDDDGKEELRQIMDAK